MIVFVVLSLMWLFVQEDEEVIEEIMVIVWQIEE